MFGPSSEFRELTLCEKTRDRRTEDENTFGRAMGPQVRFSLDARD